MSNELDQQTCLFQLGEAYETVNSTYKIIVQMVTITLGAQAALISIWFEGNNPMLLFVSGIISLLLVYQLNRTSRVLTAASITALSLEERLGISNLESLSGTFITSFRGIRFFQEIKKIATRDDKLFSQDWSKTLSKHSLYSLRHSGTTKIFFVLGIAQIAIGVYILLFPS